MLRVLLAVQLLLLDAVIVPGPTGLRSPMREPVVWHLILPLQQRAVGRIAGRQLAVIALLAATFAWFAYANLSAAPFKPAALVSLPVAIRAAVIWLAVYLLLLVFEVLVRCQPHTDALASYVRGTSRRQSVAGSWLASMLQQVPLLAPDRQQKIAEYIDAAKDESFSPDADADFRAIHDALALAPPDVNGALDTRDISRSLGRAHPSRFAGQALMYLASALLSVFVASLLT